MLKSISMINKRNYINKTIQIVIIMLSILMILSGCYRGGVELKNGFIFDSGNADPIPKYLCAYQSDYNEFDIGFVYLDFYFGGWFTSEIKYELQHESYPSFRLFFSNDQGEKYLIKEVKEQLVSEKYACYVAPTPQGSKIEVLFNHSETLRVPAHLFSEEEGRIYFSIYGANEKSPVNTEEKYLGGTGFNYRVVEGKVILSN